MKFRRVRHNSSLQDRDTSIASSQSEPPEGIDLQSICIKTYIDRRFFPAKCGLKSRKSTGS
jgi:hypothetical protein